MELFDILHAHICTNNWKSHTAKNSYEGTRKSSCISESITAIKIEPFVSYSKWPGELGSIGCVFIACSVPCTCTFDPARPFFPKLCTSFFPWKLSFFLLAQVCYTADCNVLMLWRSSCSSTLPYLYHKPKHICTGILQASAPSTTTQSNQ